MKILLIPDEICTNKSGALAAKKAIQLLLVKHEVSIYAYDKGNEYLVEDDVKLYKRINFRLIHHIYSKKTKNEFLSIIKNYKPDLVFFLGMAIDKPLILYKILIKYKIPYMIMFWRQDFYCYNTYACSKKGPCSKCLNNKSHLPFFDDCSKKEKNKIRYFIKFILYRIFSFNLKKVMSKSSVILGSSADQINRLIEFGLDKNLIKHCNLFFDKSRVDIKVNCNKKKNDYYLIYGGAPIYEKGFHFIKKLIENTDNNIKFLIPFQNEKIATLFINEYFLNNEIKAGRLIIKKNISWNTGAKELLESAKAVILPSVWPSTTEYTFLESLGCGKVVFSWDIGVYKDIIIDEYNGFKSEVGDYLQMAKKIMTYDKNIKKYEFMKNKIYELFNEMVDRNQLLEIVEGICSDDIYR